MKLQLIGHDEKYVVEQTLLALFPAETLTYGVIKMNVDTDTQYAFTRPIVDHMFKNYDGVIKVDGEVGVKKVYDPRSYLKAGEKGMAERVIEATHDLKSFGKSLCK